MGQVAQYQVPVDPQTDPSRTEEKPAGDAQRPSWLPEKFKSGEELAKSYVELEKKISSKPVSPAVTPAKTEEKPAVEPTAATAEQTSKIAPFIEEFTKNGKLSDESYTKLAADGITKEMVAAYQKGATGYDWAPLLDSTVGGADGFKEINEWATKNISKEEIEEYNLALAEGPYAAKAALKELKTRYDDANGVEPKVKVAGKGTASTSNKFRSQAEFLAAIADPRYEKDPAYRKDVLARA